MPRQYSMDTRSQATAATRTRVLDAAIDVLADVGVGALTMQAVAAQADVALRTVYNHFPSKEALVVEAYSRLARITQEAVAHLPATNSARERLLAFVDAFYDSYELESPGASVIMSVTGIPEFDAQLAAVRTWRRRELTAMLRLAEREGMLRIPMKQAVATAFLWTAFATWRSLAEESKLGPAGAKDVARKALDTLLFGLPPR